MGNLVGWWVINPLNRLTAPYTSYRVRIFSLEFKTRSLEFAPVVGLRDAFVGIRGGGWTSRRLRWTCQRVRWNSRPVVGLHDAFVGIRGGGWTSRAFVGIRGRWLDFAVRSLEFAGRVVGLHDAFVGIRGGGWTSQRSLEFAAVVGLHNAFVGIRGRWLDFAVR